MYLASILVTIASILGAYNINILSEPTKSHRLSISFSNQQLAMTSNLQTEGTVRILTQNMFMRPPLIKNNENDWKNERLDYFIDHILPQYDVICLQEMFEFASSRRSRLLAAARKQGFEYYVASERQLVWNLAIDGGLLIMSRYPIVHMETMEYQRGMGPDWLAKKGVLYAKIAVKEQQHMHIMTTHTQASYGEVVVTQPDVKRRLAQLFEFHQFMARVLPPNRQSGEPVLLTGDFNVDSRSHILSNPSDIKYEREVEDGRETSDEGKAMMSILQGHGIDPALLGPNNKDAFKGKTVLEFHDSLKERLGYHPVTFGNILVDERGQVRARETILTTKHDNEVMHSIDYVLWHNPQNATAGARAELAEVGVVPNFTPDSQLFTQISDHYGVSARVIFK